jgi:hypothetical protein
MQWEFKTQLVAVEDWTRRRGGNTGTSADKVKPPKFDKFTSWTVFHHQFETITSHKDWTSCEKVIHLLAVLQGQAANTVSQLERHAKTLSEL